ncbi:MAG TPA: hypothetical protein VGY30_12250 [Solirubrobacteraceae bacterium]|jgi:hypothetical protein|nr:hypothetical protein [Solirubrobacteraceae bacterium]
MTPEQANDANAPPAPTAKPLVGVLAALPRTRPQRASPRRAAARARAQSETAAAAPPRGEGAKTQAKPKPRSKPTTPKASAKKKTAKRRPPTPVEERAPKQGYEPEEEVELGNTVHPPSGGELIESLADIVGELVGAGAGAGGRLLKDALSIFRRP